jgi:hypothetical protein
MKQTLNADHSQWTILPRGDGARWSGMYVTLNPKGRIALSRTTFERIGAPAAVQIMYDMMNSRLALRPVSRDAQHAYPVGIYGTCGGKVIRAYRLLTEFGIKPIETIEFNQPKIDPDGQLVLDLKDIRVSRRAEGWQKRR